MIHLLALALALLLIIAISVGIVTSIRREPPSEPVNDLANRLYPFVETKKLDEDDLWQAIGGSAGCRKVYRAAKQMARDVRYLPESTERNEIVLKKLLLFWATRRCIYWEAPLKSAFPAYPRLNAWIVARLLCDMATAYNHIALTMNSETQSVEV